MQLATLKPNCSAENHQVEPRCSNVHLITSDRWPAVPLLHPWHTDSWVGLQWFITMAESMIHFSTVRRRQPPTNLSTWCKGHKMWRSLVQQDGSLTRFNTEVEHASESAVKDTAGCRWGSALSCRCSEGWGAARKHLRTEDRLERVNKLRCFKTTP